MSLAQKLPAINLSCNVRGFFFFVERVLGPLVMIFSGWALRQSNFTTAVMVINGGRDYCGIDAFPECTFARHQRCCSVASGCRRCRGDAAPACSICALNARHDNYGNMH